MYRPEILFKRNITGILWLAFMVLMVSGCNLNNANSGVTPDTQDVQTASQIMGESLASNSGGMMSSMGDVGTVNDNGYNYSVNPAMQVPYSTENPYATEGDTSQSEDFNFAISYDSTTGVHTISFDRSANKDNVTKNVHVELEFTFRDSTGTFMKYPLIDKLESIDFKDFRKGSYKSATKNSTFSRKDTLLYTGLRQSSNVVSINGSHYGSGDFQWTDSTGAVLERTYNVKIKIIDVTVPKTDISNSDASHGVTGTLTYDITLVKKSGSNNKTKHLTGTIELNGDGTALLRFANFPKRFLVHLGTGDVEED